MALTKIDDRGLKTPIDLLDNEKIRFGTGNDLEIYHDGSHSFIKDAGTGNLRLGAADLRIQTEDFAENYILGTKNGSVDLYYDNSKKAETASWGLNVLGNCGVGDSSKFQCGDGQDLEIWHDGSGSQINNSTGYLVIQSDDLRLRDKANGHPYLKAVADGAVELYHDNVKKLETADFGLRASDSIYTDEHLYIDNDTGRIKLGTGADLQIYHDGSHSYIKDTGTGELRLASNQFTVQNAASDETLLYAVQNGAVGLKYDDSLKIETKSYGTYTTGIGYVTGGWRPSSNGGCSLGSSSYRWYDLNISNDIDVSDNGVLRMGDSDDLLIYHAGNSSWVKETGEGRLYLDTNGDSIYLISDSSGTYGKMGVFKKDAEVNLYYDNSEKFATTSTGINITGGIRLGGDNAANELDDYEEGTWTPGISFGNGTTGITYDTAGIDATGGWYTKIGRLVTVTAHIKLTSKGSSTGSCRITGLPFSTGSASDDGGRASGSVGYVDNFALAAPILVLVEPNDDKFNLRKYTASFDDSDSLTHSNFTDTSRFFLSISYHV